MKKIYLFNIFVFFFIVLFCSLGTWQLYRLDWKENLINEIREGLNSTPVKYSHSLNKSYQRVYLKGEYDFNYQIYLYSLNEKGQPGYDVITPFKTSQSKNVLINRGWISKEKKEKPVINFTEKSRIQGLLKKQGKKNIFKPKNDVKNNIWFSLNINQIQNFTGKNFSNHVVYLEDDSINVPLPKKISIDLPNNHLKYAITWYSISISILLYFLYFRRSQ